MLYNKKNIALLNIYILSEIPSFFYGWDLHLNLGIFIERTTRVDWFVNHYSIAIQFIIYAYCLKFPKNIDSRIITTVLAISLLDLLDMILFSGMFLSKTKIMIGLIFGFRQDIHFVLNRLKKYINGTTPSS